MIETEKMQTIPMSDERKRDQEINAKYLNRKSNNQTVRFRKNAENYASMVRNYREIFGINVLPKDKPMP